MASIYAGMTILRTFYSLFRIFKAKGLSEGFIKTGNPILEICHHQNVAKIEIDYNSKQTFSKIDDSSKTPCYDISNHLRFTESLEPDEFR